MSIIEAALRKSKLAGGSGGRTGNPPEAATPNPVARMPATAPAEPAERPQERRPLVATPIAIDQTALREGGLLPEGAEAWRYRDQYREIKRHLLRGSAATDSAQARAKFSNLIMITSSLPGEGKTYTSFNLGLSIARERDYSVILIDADLAKSGLTRLLGLENRKGLVDLLREDRLTLEDVIIPTDIPGLKVIPAGPYDETATELLASSAMSRRIAALTTDYASDIVLFDSGPLLVSSEAPVLAHVVPQVAMVVQAGVTLQDSVLDALLRISDQASVGFILNGWEPVAIFEQEHYGKHSEYGVASGPQAEASRARS